MCISCVSSSSRPVLSVCLIASRKRVRQTRMKDEVNSGEERNKEAKKGASEKQSARCSTSGNTNKTFWSNDGETKAHTALSSCERVRPLQLFFPFSLRSPAPSYSPSVSDVNTFLQLEGSVLRPQRTTRRALGLHSLSLSRTSIEFRCVTR